MKNVLFLALCLLRGVVMAQNELWPTANAEWHYGISSMSTNGFVKIKIDRDTVIDGKNCQIYTREYKWKNTSIPIYADSVFQGTNDPWFILSLEDSVLYAFNKYRSQFDTLLNFKAEIGDRWQFYQNIDVCSDDTNAHILIELTGKSTEVVNGKNLLTFTTKKISTEEMEFPDNETVFYQKIGFLQDYFVPRFCYDISEAPQISLRCFTENKGLSNEFFYQRGSIGCESLLKTADDLITEKMTVVNPVLDNIIRINNLNMSDLKTIQLFDNLGKELKISFQTEQGNCLITPEKHLTTGIYFCSVELHNGQKQTIKISVNN